MKRLQLFVLLPLVALGLGVSAVRANPVEVPDTFVELVAFGSLQCPYTARADATMVELSKKYGENLSIRWVHRPLVFHKRAVPAAIAVEAATRQNARIPMIRAILADRQGMEDADLARHAASLNMDVKQFQRDLDTPAVAAQVDRDTAAADALNVTATPTFFINGQRLAGAQPTEKFEALIDAELAAMAAGGVNAHERTRAQNAPLAAYLYDGTMPTPQVEVATAQTPEKTVAPDARVQVPVDVKSDGILGRTYAPVTFVVLTDYMCPFCRKYDETLAALLKANPTRLRVVIKQRPLAFHRNAPMAAAAALCAREAGQTFFARMHQALMAAPTQEMPVDAFVKLAKKAGLDAQEFKTCLHSDATTAHLKADADLAVKVGASGTPTTFVNGFKVVGARPLAELKAIVETAAAEAEAQTPRDMELDAVYEFLTSGAAGRPD